MKKLLWGICLLLMTVCPGRVQAAAADFPSLNKEYICAWMSLASYSDRIGLAARAELEASGWELVLRHEEKKRTDAKFYYARRTAPDGAPLYLLAVAGTESQKDLRNDLNIGKVYFAGKTAEEFAANAKRRRTDPAEPQVHGGFNEYVQAAFFTPLSDGTVAGELFRDRLLADRRARLCLTGHSLGGASAVIFGQRLIAMGVPADQIEVITFGTPAVGNEAFCRLTEESGLQLDRVIITGDPVHGVLQKLAGGYHQFDTVTAWRRNHNCDLFRHAMTVYLDAALREYYCENTAFPPGEKPDIYAIIKIKLGQDISGDGVIMRRAAEHFLQRTLKGRVHFAADPELSFHEQLKAAQKMGASFVLTEEIDGHILKNERSRYAIGLQETIYDTAGNLAGGFGATTSTAKMTPIEGVLYDIVYARSERERILQ